MTDSTARSPLIAATLALAALIPLTAAASQDTAGPEDEPTAREQGGRECFFARQVTGIRNVEDDDTRVLIDVRAGETFEFQLQRRCPELRFARSVRLDQTGIGRVCDGLEVDLVVPDPNLGPQRCPITMVRRVPAGEPGARAAARN